MRFPELLDAIIADLTTISIWPVKANGTLVAQLLHQVSSDVVVYTLVILDNALVVTK